MIDQVFLDDYIRRRGRPAAIKLRWRMLSDLRIRAYTGSSRKRISWVCAVNESPVYRFLQGDVLEYERHIQAAPGKRVHHTEGLKALLASIQKYGYREPYLVTRTGDKVLLDGHHRAAVLWHCYGDIGVLTADIVYPTDFPTHL